MPPPQSSSPSRGEEIVHDVVNNVRPSIHLAMIRHAESANNEVYLSAKFLFRVGTEQFDRDGCEAYISTHRKADPALSAKGYAQAEALADYLVPHLENQASHPVRILVSPMRRTLLTIKPTLERLQKVRLANADTNAPAKAQIMVVAFYFETEGCHLRGQAEEGMAPDEIRELLQSCVSSEPENNRKELQFVGFHDSGQRGWYVDRTSPETRAEGESRAAKYCLWLSEYLDQQLQQGPDARDVFDASISLEGEAHEDEHDKHAPRTRQRRTALAIGHGDFMSTVLKRMVSGFGHYVENDGSPHLSAFAHFNTGITELEYFGHGRYLIMSTNQTPHIQANQNRNLRSGGTLKDGWSFLMPTDQSIFSEAEVSVVFSDEDLENHVREQTVALRALYLSSSSADAPHAPSTELEVEEEQEGQSRNVSHFVVKRGLQVVGVATYSDDTGQLSDVAIRPTTNVNDCVAETLMQAVKKHARKLGRSSSLIVHPRSIDAMELFEKMGFAELEDIGTTEDGSKDKGRKQVMTFLL